MEELLTVLKKVFSTAYDMYLQFGWRVLALVTAVVVIMIPVNLLIKRIFKNKSSDVAQRFRKACSSAFVFIMSFGIVSGYELLFGNKEFDVLVNAEDAINIGIVAMAVWAVIKIVRDIGIEPILVKIANSNQARTIIKSIGKDAPIVNRVYKTLESVLAEKAAKADQTIGEYVVKNGSVLQVEASNLLSVYNVDINKIIEDAQTVVQALRVKHTSK